MSRRISTRALALAALVAALAVGISQFDPPTPVTSIARATGWTDPSAAPKPPGAPVTGPDFSAIVERYSPAVVNVAVEGSGKPAPQEGPRPQGLTPGEPPRLGPPDHPPDQPVFGLGSGFIIASDGVILTSAHVVAEASTVTVRLSDQREFAARVVGLDRPSDVAVLKIDARDLPTVAIGDVSRLRVGAWVLAIGSPYGFDSTATAGIVSATTRSLPNQAYVPFIQTDVPVNPGNSGGPLFNAAGEVIGINSQIFTGTGGFQGLSFAVPIDVAMKVGKQLAAGTSIRRGWLGAAVQEVTQPLAEAFGLPGPGGALVSSVDKDGPAAKAGLQSGDVILKVDGASLARSADLPPRIADAAPGSQVTFDVWRQHQMHRIGVDIGELKADPPAAPKPPAKGPGKLGLLVRPLSPQEAKGLGESSGLLVQTVSGPAAQAGLQPGDIILAFNDEPVTSAEQLRSLADKGHHHVALLVRRDGAKLFLPLDLG
jgi:serine protease Do